MRRKSLWYPLHFSLSENKKMVECRRNLKNDDSNSVTHRGKEKNKKELKKKQKGRIYKTPFDCCHHANGQEGKVVDAGGTKKRELNEPQKI